MSHTSWKVDFDFPIHLQFGGYIAQQEKFGLTETTSVLSQAEFEWRTWWRSLLNISSNLSKTNNTSHLTINFTPPTFTDVEHLSEIQILCRSHWSKFHDQWAQKIKRDSNNKMRKQIQHVQIEKVIQDCAKRAGKNYDLDFNLVVNFIQYPIVYVQSVTKEHLVVHSQFIEPSMLKDFRDVLYQQITNIIQSD